MNNNSENNKKRGEFKIEVVTIDKFNDFRIHTKEINEMRDKRLDDKFNDLKKYLDDTFVRIVGETNTNATYIKTIEKEIIDLNEKIDKMKEEEEKKEAVRIAQQGSIKFKTIISGGVSAIAVIGSLIGILISLHII